mmetsp:Transcript_47484/g.111749  ORF Transcript_47484/g.111749 Transcript_47484/m.111749 type:complete len:83 (+) Transcript_47484:15-263(+)
MAGTNPDCLQALVEARQEFHQFSLQLSHWLSEELHDPLEKTVEAPPLDPRRGGRLTASRFGEAVGLSRCVTARLTLLVVSLK